MELQIELDSTLLLYVKHVPKSHSPENVHLLDWDVIYLKELYAALIYWAFGLVVWFSLRVREVPSSILGMPQSFFIFKSANSKTSKIAIQTRYKVQMPNVHNMWDLQFQPAKYIANYKETLDSSFLFHCPFRTSFCNSTSLSLFLHVLVLESSLPISVSTFKSPYFSNNFSPFLLLWQISMPPHIPFKLHHQAPNWLYNHIP